ncbi:lipoprotein N-acyltransferase Lnb domain-containing protein [Marilutibacter alkalisoli]|uniref:DUF4105 domain-containing protein n=1 Tax=Marilutibacter alkalisoli TaxID=2591633 RepID=A0A514BPU5_9GAMM|nr:DUF4105 domain-containing protein [Lysobacter alkalisoli]QDH69403.1 DUF4105 domain-containing protein [Lysobacter alkalisoli]
MLERGLAALLTLLLLVLSAAPALADDGTPPPRIGIVTMQPGEIFFERFGHNAVLVEDPRTGEALSYNYGFFDPDEPDFITRFMRGDMQYQLVALPFARDLAYYERVGRGASIQWLDLSAGQARNLADALASNARPENARYRYDYFLDNCSTRVRDAIDLALDGGLQRQLEGRSHGTSFRSEALRLASPDPLMWLGFDIGLGPAADMPQPLWNESFVPMRLETALRGVRNDATGQPLVKAEQPLLPQLLPPEPAEQALAWWPWALAGIALGIALVWLGRRRPRLTAGIALPFWLLCSVLGALMLFIWFGTEHRFGWANRNLLLFSPLCWLLLPGGWQLLRRRRPGRWFDILLVMVAALPVAALFFYWLQVQPQRNLHWIVLLWPIHIGLLAGLRRSGTSHSYGPAI